MSKKRILMTGAGSGFGEGAAIATFLCPLGYQL
jgi:NADP-dependent 3-hydroxy acid dehydrogenase YdfG